MNKYNCSFSHELNYIYWKKEATVIIVNNDEFADIVKKLKKRRHQIPYCTNRLKYDTTTFSIKKKGNYFLLFYYDGRKGYITYNTNSYDNEKNERVKKSTARTGSHAISLLHSKFREFNYVRFSEAFGNTDEVYKRCIPKQICYYNKLYFNKELIFSSIDGNSQYPASICGILPDYHTAIAYNGVIKPNEEYPFAFYIESGHLAEFGVFDTHNWIDHPFFESLFRYGKEEWPINPVKDNEEITVLMKPSQYTFDETMRYFFDAKQKYPKDSKEYLDAKLVMNAAIGMLHTRKYEAYKYAHLVAICLARSNQKILNQVEKIKPKFVVQICVDGIIYLGDAIATKNKNLGEFNQEFENCKGIISNYNKYIVEDEHGNIVKFKQGNCNKWTDGRDILPEDVKDIHDQYNWILDDPLKNLKEFDYD